MIWGALSETAEWSLGIEILNSWGKKWSSSKNGVGGVEDKEVWELMKWLFWGKNDDSVENQKGTENRPVSLSVTWWCHQRTLKRGLFVNTWNSTISDKWNLWGCWGDRIENEVSNDRDPNMRKNKICVFCEGCQKMVSLRSLKWGYSWLAKEYLFRID